MRIEDQCAGIKRRTGVTYKIQVRCYNRGIYEEDGKRWCGTHLPSKVAARQARIDREVAEREALERHRETELTLLRAARLVYKLDPGLAVAIRQLMPRILRGAKS